MTAPKKQKTRSPLEKLDRRPPFFLSSMGLFSMLFVILALVILTIAAIVVFNTLRFRNSLFTTRLQEAESNEPKFTSGSFGYTQTSKIFKVGETVNLAEHTLRVLEHNQNLADPKGSEYGAVHITATRLQKAERQYDMYIFSGTLPQGFVIEPEENKITENLSLTPFVFGELQETTSGWITYKKPSNNAKLYLIIAPKDMNPSSDVAFIEL